MLVSSPRYLELATFFDQWQQFEGRRFELPSHQSTRFFTQLAGYKKGLPSLKSTGASCLALQDTSNFLHSLKDLMTQECRQGNQVNLWRLFNFGQNEKKNCALLAWLLDCESDHGQGNLFFKIFLEAVCDYEGRSFRGELAQTHLSFAPVNYTVQREIASNYGRVDIEIRSPNFVCIIETKINSVEGCNNNGDNLQEYTDQLTRYVKYAQRINPHQWTVIFLTRNGTLPRNDAIRDKVLCITWEDLGRKIEEKLQTTYLDKESLAWKLISSYCNYLKQL